MAPLDTLIAPFLTRRISEQQVAQLELYLDLLLKWNARISLTAIRGREEIARRHFGESLFAAEQLSSNSDATLADFGSGAGFPGLPIAIHLPHFEVTLIESQQKKVAFLREVIRTLSLKNASVFAGRAESSGLKSQIVTLRAVERFESILPVAAALVAAGGRLALLIGSGQAETARRTLPAIEWGRPIPIPQSRERILLIGTSVDSEMA
ncbi:MAG TPA: 16S rRNA (guanine(527)-N(7))-methyltransferase RsmG [Terriglobales bacterium]|nr:16S rRNA (guanine(527)-N(7))-methyltransferase RsmG [Terriglobales bacterium]